MDVLDNFSDSTKIKLENCAKNSIVDSRMEQNMRKSFIFLFSVFLVCGFSFGQKMSPPVKIYDSPLHASKWGQVAFGPDGKVHIVWEEDYSNSGGSDIFYMSYDGETWEGPVKLKDSRNINAERPDICAGPTGAVFAVWNQDGEVYMREYDPENEEWLPVKKVSTADYGANEPGCAADPDGNVYITWHNYNTGRAFSRAKVNGQWETIRRLSGGLRSTQTGVAAGKDGQIWMFFREKQSGGEYKIYYNKRTKDTGWAIPRKMNWDGASQAHPHIAVGPDNVALVTYADIDEHEAIEVWICTIDENQNPREMIVPPSFMHYSRIAIDSLGNKHLAWQIGPGDGGTGIKYKNNINRKEGQWNGSIFMQNSGGGPKLPGIAADDYGNVALVWASSSGSNDKNIWFSSLYPVTITPPPPPPPPPIPESPVNLDVGITIKSLKRSSLITYNLSWEKNPENTDENVAKYMIYKKENGGEFEPLISLTPTNFSAKFSFETLNKKIQFGISTVYLFETGLFLTDESESDIVIFGNQQ